MNLTDKTIQTLKPGKKEQVVWGNGGFGVRVTADGKKTFILEYRLGEVYMMMALGTYPDMSLKAARQAAVKAFEKILNKADSVKEKKPVPKTAAKETETKAPPPLPKPPIVKSQAAKMETAPPEEKEAPPAEEEKSSGLVKEGGRILSKSEIKIFWNALAHSLMPPRSQLALKLLMVTAQPCEEVVVAKWTDFDLVGKMWNIPAAQTVDGKKHQIPLTNLALSMLRKIKEVSGAGGVLFPGGPGPLLDAKSLDGDLQHAQFRMNMGSFTVEDLQQSIVAQMLDVKIPEPVVAKVVNHPEMESITGSENVADRDIRDALKKWQEVLKRLGLS